MCVNKVQHVMGRKTGCNRSRPVFFGFSIFRQTSQLATEKIQNLCNCNRWSGLLRLGSVRFRSFFQSSELDLRTLGVAMLRSQGVHPIPQPFITIFNATEPIIAPLHSLSDSKKRSILSLKRKVSQNEVFTK